MQILFLSAWFPFPAVHGSKLRISNLLRILAEQHEVDLISFADRPREELNLEAAGSFCREVRLVPDRGFNPDGWKARLGFMSPVPRSLKEMFSEEMAQAIREQTERQRYDRVIASATRMASYRPFLDTTPALFEEAEVGVLYDQWAEAESPVRRFRSRLTWEKHRRYLARLVRDFDLTTVVSNREKELLAVTLGAVDDTVMMRRILAACQTLLVPGAIRSLADRPVTVPLAVRRDGRLLNDPQAPYWGRYEGDEDTRRKPAYHNGTAWTWPFPSYCEAWVQCYGPSGAETALAWLSSSVMLINSGCVGQVPEIVDGDAPHRQRGCDAQAWGVSELLRVWRKVHALLGNRMPAG